MDRRTLNISRCCLEPAKMKAVFRSTDAKSFRYCILGRGAAGTSPCAASLEQTVLCPEMYATLQYLSPPGRTNAAGNRNVSACAISHCFHEFQDKVHVYLMLEYAAGGERANHKAQTLGLTVVKFLRRRTCLRCASFMSIRLHIGI